MLIRIGFEMEIDCPKPTPMLLALHPNPEIKLRIIGSDRIRAEPGLRIDEYTDAFGNRCARIEAPAGRTTLWSDCVVEDDGKPDVFNWNAR